MDDSSVLKPGMRVFCFLSRKDFSTRSIGAREGKPLTVRLPGIVDSVDTGQVGVILDVDKRNWTMPGSTGPGATGCYWVTYVPISDVIVLTLGSDGRWTNPLGGHDRAGDPQLLV